METQKYSKYFSKLTRIAKYMMITLSFCRKKRKRIKKSKKKEKKNYKRNKRSMHFM